GTITSWNRSAQRMYGYTPAEAIGQPISLIVPADKEAERRELFERVGRGEGIDPFETARVTKEGRGLTIFLTLSPIYDADGRIISVSGIDRDISERKASDIYRAELAAIVEGSHDAIFGKTIDGIITRWN